MKTITIIFLVLLSFVSTAQIQSFSNKGDNIYVTTLDSTYIILIDSVNTSGEYDNYFNILDNYTSGEDVEKGIYQIAKQQYNTVDRLVIQGNINTYIIGISETAPSSTTKLSSGDKTKFDVFYNKLNEKINQ